MRCSTRLFALALLPALLLASQAARGQTTTPTPTVVAASGQPYPARIVNGANLGFSTRGPGLNPLGVNYSDCIQDMILRFSVVASGFDGTHSLQVWATKSGDCTSTTSRGAQGTNSVVTCWLVDQGSTGQVINTSQQLTFDVRVQDLVGGQNAPPNGQANVRRGPEACTAQPTFVGVPMDIWFLPLDASGAYGGSGAFDYKIATDLAGPPPPIGVSKAVGETLFSVNWTVNLDADTYGYDVFIDPIPGQEGSSPTGPTDSSVLVCPDTGTPVATVPDADSEAGDDGSTADAAGDDGATSEAAAVVVSSSDASCYSVTVGGTYGGSTGSSTCPTTSAVLASSVVQDSGVVQEVDEAGNLIEGGTISGSGGISTIPAQYLVPGGNPTVPGKTNGNYTITGLVDGVNYHVVVAAVDGSGNVGPPSPEVCDYPAPVNDFWNLYRQAGGRAGGGFCALEAVGEPVPSAAGLALVAVTSALVLRRRRQRR